MRHTMIVFGVLLALAFQELSASPKTDSIVAFLDGAHAKFVWARWAWCNGDYTPKNQAAAEAEGMSLMLLDTREGTEREVMSGLRVRMEYFTRISRSGKWAVVADGSVKKSYIVDLTAASPQQKVLLEQSSGWDYWRAVAWWIDPDNGNEYVIAGNSVPDVGLTEIYKVKVNADGAADISGATKIPNENNSAMDGAISVSADGKKLGGAFPWPNVKILDIPTGNLTDRHAGGFGCQANLAPDNSYRLFHCEGDHLGIMMFGTDLSDNTNWFVNLATNLVGVSGGMDFIAPRWSNHVQYVTAAFPMGDNHESYFEGGEFWGDLWGLSAAGVQGLEMENMPQVFLGKFSADFRTQEKSILIASDPRYVQTGCDAWICTGVTDGTPCGETVSSDVIHTGSVPISRIQRAGLSVSIHTGSASSVIRISDARGRIIRTWRGTGTCALDAQNLSAGAYLVSVTAGARSETIRLPLTGVSR